MIQFTQYSKTFKKKIGLGFEHLLKFVTFRTVKHVIQNGYYRSEQKKKQININNNSIFLQEND